MKIEALSLKKDVSLRLFNTILRAITLGSRFILFFFLARFLTPDEIGYYGLFSGTLLFCILLIGLDFYTFSQREILSSSACEHSKIIIRQAIFHLTTYLFVLPLTAVVFIFDFIPQRFFFWFYLLLPLEHIAQELSRILIAMGHPLFSGFILFLKMGFWTWIGLAGILYIPTLRHIEFIFLLWSIGCIISIVFSLYVINKQILTWVIPRWDWGWALKGTKTGILFLASSLSFRALTTFDKYIVNYFSGPDILGVYVFFTSISASLMTFMDSGVFVFLYPNIVESCRKKQWGRFRKATSRLIRDTLSITTALTCLALSIVPYMTELLGKEVYIKNLPIFWCILAATALRSCSMIPHYLLYAFGKDRVLFLSQSIGIFVFFLACFLIPKNFDTLIVPLALSLSFAAILTTKTCYSIFYWKKNFIENV